jgi:uncharacterized protein (TIGR00645 family)
MSEPEPHAVSVAIQRGLVAARWIMVPLYLCMAIVLALIAAKFGEELVHAVPHVLEMQDTELIATALTLVDLTLVANLVSIVTLVGYENFVERMLPQAGPLPAWLAHIDLGGLKLKLIASIISIAAIDLLKRYLEVNDTPRADLVVQTGVFLAFVLAGVMLAWMEKLSGHGD